MVVYWLLFGYFAVGAMLGRDVPPGQSRGPLLLIVGSILIAVLIGLRYEVGGDWESYEFWYSYARYADLFRMLQFKDPGYQLLNWVAQQLGLGIWLVNLICGAIFSWGLYRFARVQSDPWLAMLVAIPYLVIVVAMGYTRQAVAIGILMAGLASVVRGGSALQFALWVFAAALFHRTAVVALPLVGLVGERNRMINILVIIAAAILLYDVILEDSMEGFVRNYIEAGYSSQGAWIRLIMDAVPATIFLVMQRRFQFSDRERQLWRNYSFAAIGLVALMFVSPSTTVVDRIALYILPLQLAVFSRIPGSVFAKSLFSKLIIVVAAFAIQFVWLNFAAHAEHWLPYQFYPF